MKSGRTRKDAARKRLLHFGECRGASPRHPKERTRDACAAGPAHAKLTSRSGRSESRRAARSVEGAGLPGAGDRARVVGKLSGGAGRVGIAQSCRSRQCGATQPRQHPAGQRELPANAHGHAFAVGDVRCGRAEDDAEAASPSVHHAHVKETDENGYVIPIQDAGLQTYLRSLDIRSAH